MTNAQQQKLDAFFTAIAAFTAFTAFTAIAAVKALGEGYQKMVYALEDDLYALQMEILADEKKQRDYEKDAYVKQCRIAEVKAEAEQREKEIKARLKALHARMNRMIEVGVRSGDDYYAVYHEEIALMIELQDVWSKYNCLMNDQ